LCPADYGRDATTRAGHQTFAATRPTGRGGMQGAESEFRIGSRAILIRVEDTLTKLYPPYRAAPFRAGRGLLETRPPEVWWPFLFSGGLSGCRACRCDDGHSALDCLVFCCECTVVPGGAVHDFPPNLGPADWRPSFFTGVCLTSLAWRSRELLPKDIKQ
jgi:hypothetical protein